MMVAWNCPVQGRAGPFPGWIRLHPTCMTHGAHMRCITAPLQLRGAPFRTPLVCPQSLRAQLPVKHPKRPVVSPFLSLPCVSGRDCVPLPGPKAQMVMQSSQPPPPYRESHLPPGPPPPSLRPPQELNPPPSINPLVPPVTVLTPLSSRPLPLSTWTACTSCTSTERSALFFPSGISGSN